VFIPFDEIFTPIMRGANNLVATATRIGAEILDVVVNGKTIREWIQLLRGKIDEVMARVNNGSNRQLVTPEGVTVPAPGSNISMMSTNSNTSGTNDPFAKAIRALFSGETVDDFTIRAFKRQGFSIDDLVRWKRAGFTLDEIKILALNNIKIEDAIAFREENPNITVGEIIDSSDVIARQMGFDEMQGSNFPPNPPSMRGEPTYGTQTGDTSANARILRQKMYAQGMTSSPDDIAHHIIPSTMGQVHSLRVRLQGWNIDINQAQNGIFLQPKIHGRIHAGSAGNREYALWLESRFQGVTTREEALEVLEVIRTDLSNGNYP
jgi:HNH/ENDO VII superfamily nuclease